MLHHVAHVGFGLLTSICSIVSPILSIINTICFIIYELDEEWNLSDKAYEEIMEYMLGLGIGEIILLIFHIII
jgi:hypothetical protein